MRTLLLLFLCLPFCLHAQAPAIEWQHTYGGTLSEQGHNVAPTSDGGYVVAGLGTSNDGDVTGNHGSNDYWIVKTDANGTLQWEKSYGGTGDDKAYSISQTADGGYIVAGSSSSSDGDVTGAHGSLDFWILKLDATGGLVWQKALGGTGAEAAYNIIQTNDGGYGVVGLETSTNGDVTGNHGSFDMWFCKLDASGNLSWQKTLGGTATDQAFGVVQTNDSGYVICGYSSSSDGDVTGAHGNNDYWIVKINKTGTLVWQHAYGGTGSDRAFNIAKTFDKGFIVNGVSPSTDGDVTGNHGDNDYWVLKLDSNGVATWKFSYGGTGDDFGRSVVQTLDSGYILGGRSNTPNDGDVTGNHGLYDYWVVKLTQAGAIQWEQSYGGSANESAPGSLVPFTNVIQLTDGKYVMAGYTYSTDDDVIGNVSTTATDDNYWLVKLYACPVYTTLRDTICPGHTYTFNAMQLDTTGTYYDTLLSVSGCDSFVTLHLWLQPEPVITGTGASLSTGTFLTYHWLLNGQPITGATNQNYIATQNGNYSVVITDGFGCTDTSAVHVVTGLKVSNTLLASDISIFPNPVNNKVNISFPYTSGEITIAIYGIDGQLLMTKRYSNTAQAVIPFDNYSTGVYTLKVTTPNGQTAIKKLIKY